MNFRSILTATIFAAVASTATIATADIVVKKSDVAEPASEVEVDASEQMISVPEPATFGILSVGLAVGCGLLVRNKRPEA